MFAICHTEIATLPTGVVSADLLHRLPAALRLRIAAYKSEPDRLARIAGKLLLLEAHEQIGVRNKLVLNQLQYTSENRPFIEGGLHFSIAHAYPYVVCAVGSVCPVGIDIEVPAGLDVAEFAPDYLTENELRLMQSSPDPVLFFHRLWVRKEAILKCAGVSVGHEMPEVLEGSVRYRGNTLHLTDIDIRPGACCSMASMQPPKNIAVKSVDFTAMVADFIK